MNKQRIISGICALSIFGIVGVNALSDANNVKQESSVLSNYTHTINAKTSNKKMMTTGSLNIRSGPSTKYKTLGKLKKGQTITITGTNGNWSKFTYNGKTAYVSTKYLKTVSSSNTTTSTKMKTTSSLNVRSGPSTKYKVLGKLKKGQTITVKSTTNGWSKFTYNGKTAYVSAKYLKKATSNTDSNNNNNNNNNTNYPVAKNVTSSKIGVRKLKTDAYIRESATKGSKIIGIGKKGNMIEYVELVKTGLHKVIFNGKYAYIEDYDKNTDVFEVSTFGKLNGNTSNKYVKDFYTLADEILEEHGWFWEDNDKVKYKYGLVTFSSEYNKNNLRLIQIYKEDVSTEEAKMRKEAGLKVLSTIFGEKNAREILNECLEGDYTYIRKTYNGITIDIDLDSQYSAFIHF